MQKVLITGGAGFIGSHLSEKLLEKGEEVFCLDCNLPSLNHLLNSPFFHIIKHDVINPIQIEVDQIYHLACPASPIHYQKDPIRTLQTAVWGTKNILDLANDLKIPILIASTSEVYGDPLVHPQTEDYWGHVNPIGVRSCYNEGKRAAEALSMDYKRIHNVNVKIVRIFNTYGPYMSPDDGRVIPNFILNALFDQPLQIYGSGSQTRSFQYVEDLIRGMQLMINHPSFTGPVNLGNPEEYSVLELAELIIDLTSSKSEIQYLNASADDPQRRCPNIALAKQNLNWEPKVSVKEGLSKTIQYFHQQCLAKSV
jgi:UDP-glucuronate decarboxylase